MTAQDSTGVPNASIAVATAPDAMKGAAYPFPVTATASPAPQFALAGGRLPAGLSPNKVSGVISGRPTAAGFYTFRVSAANSEGADARDYTITVADPSGDS